MSAATDARVRSSGGHCERRLTRSKVIETTLEFDDGGGSGTDRFGPLELRAHGGDAAPDARAVFPRYGAEFDVLAGDGRLDGAVGLGEMRISSERRK
jgi:hypothetical protein